MGGTQGEYSRSGVNGIYISPYAIRLSYYRTKGGFRGVIVRVIEGSEKGVQEVYA